MAASRSFPHIPSARLAACSSNPIDTSVSTAPGGGGGAGVGSTNRSARRRSPTAPPPPPPGLAFARLTVALGAIPPPPRSTLPNVPSTTSHTHRGGVHPLGPPAIHSATAEPTTPQHAGITDAAPCDANSCAAARWVNILSPNRIPSPVVNVCVVGTSFVNPGMSVDAMTECGPGASPTDWKFLMKRSDDAEPVSPSHRASGASQLHSIVWSPRDTIDAMRRCVTCRVVPRTRSMCRRL